MDRAGTDPILRGQILRARDPQFVLDHLVQALFQTDIKTKKDAA
jgi:hypothetical protein